MRRCRVSPFLLSAFSTENYKMNLLSNDKSVLHLAVVQYARWSASPSATHHGSLHTHTYTCGLRFHAVSVIRAREAALFLTCGCWT